MPSDSQQGYVDKPAYSHSDFPELDAADRLHLRRLYNRYGRDRVVGWLRGKVALPTRLELAKYEGADIDEEAYYQAAADFYVETEDGDSDGK